MEKGLKEGSFPRFQAFFAFKKKILDKNTLA
jgi:hypothetical protein